MGVFQGEGAVVENAALLRGHPHEFCFTPNHGRHNRKRLGLHVGTPAFFIESKLIVKIKKRLSAYLAPSTMWSITNARAEAPTNMTAAIVINVIILITFSFLCFFNFLITTPCGRPFFFPLARCYLNYNLLVFRRCKGTKSVLCAQTVG